MKLIQKLALAYIRQSIRLMAAISPKAAARYAFRIFCTPLKGKRGSLTILAQHGEPLQVTVENKIARGLRWNKGGSKKALLLHGMHSSSRILNVTLNL